MSNYEAGENRGRSGEGMKEERTFALGLSRVNGEGIRVGSLYTAVSVGTMEQRLYLLGSQDLTLWPSYSMWEEFILPQAKTQLINMDPKFLSIRVEHTTVGPSVPVSKQYY